MACSLDFIQGQTQRFMGALPTDLRSLEVEVALGSYGMLEQRIATEPDLIGRRYLKPGREARQCG
jgi:hypothetical protein